MIPVRESLSGQFERLSGNPVLQSLDGAVRAPLAVLLHESWTDEDRAAFGVFLAEPFMPSPGKRACGAERFERIDGVVCQVFDTEEIPPRTLIDGAAFLARVTDDEYAAVIAAAAQNMQVARWLDIFRLRGEIDVAGATAQAAKAGFVTAGLFSAERADEIFASENA